MPAEQAAGLAKLAPLLLPLIAWEVLWKGIAMWKAARRDEVLWFIAIFVLNTLGILPIVYIAFFAPRRPDLVSRQ
jgi:hypothetical protein